jgi:hypothetical protein
MTTLVAHSRGTRIALYVIIVWSLLGSAFASVLLMIGD